MSKNDLKSDFRYKCIKYFKCATVKFKTVIKLKCTVKIGSIKRAEHMGQSAVFCPHIAQTF